MQILKANNLSIDSLMQEVHDSLDNELQCYDQKYRNGSRETKDYVLACLSVFYFKWSSLLTYEVQKTTAKIANNLKRLFKLNHLPSDTQMRVRIDEIDPQALRKPFTKIFAKLQRQKVLEEYSFLDGYYIISVDGTGHFSSHEVSCDNCCVKNHKDGSKTYYHQLVGASLVHPDHKKVIPLAPEPIIKQDGATKNDCELNSCRRLLANIRREHPHLKIIIVEDALFANGPHLKDLESHNMRYIIGVKPDNHKLLFDWVKHSEMTKHEVKDKDGTKHVFSFINAVPLNDANFDLEVNFIEYWEHKPNGKIQHFTWITDIEITKNNVYKLMRGGRSRWRIENETFNTLKNQGYNFEHNFGHGKVNLCTNMGMLMMLAFLIDQAQEIACKIYQKMRKNAYTYKGLWELYRSILILFDLKNFTDLYSKIFAIERSPP